MRIYVSLGIEAVLNRHDSEALDLTQWTLKYIRDKVDNGELPSTPYNTSDYQDAVHNTMMGPFNKVRHYLVNELLLLNEEHLDKADNRSWLQEKLWPIIVDAGDLLQNNLEALEGRPINQHDREVIWESFLNQCTNVYPIIEAELENVLETAWRMFKP